MVDVLVPSSGLLSAWMVAAALLRCDSEIAESVRNSLDILSADEIQSLVDSAGIDWSVLESLLTLNAAASRTAIGAISSEDLKSYEKTKDLPYVPTRIERDYMFVTLSKDQWVNNAQTVQVSYTSKNTEIHIDPDYAKMNTVQILAMNACGIKSESTVIDGYDLKIVCDSVPDQDISIIIKIEQIFDASEGVETS